MTPKPWKPFVVRQESSKVYHKPAKYRTAACRRTSGLVCDEAEERELGHRRCWLCWPEQRRTG